MTVLPPFTAHNIALPDGTRTGPAGELLAESSVCLTALGLLDEQFAGEDRSQVTVADLGCLEAGYTAAFAQAGYQATGVEARSANMGKCRLVADALKLPNMVFIQDDARNLEARGLAFDAVFCCGLLYHLDQPAAFLRMLGRITRRLLIVQSHYSVSCAEENEGYRGHWYQDHPEESDLWGSWGNQQSFWLGHGELLRAMADAGFTDVRAVDDGTWSDRETFTGLKSPQGG